MIKLEQLGLTVAAAGLMREFGGSMKWELAESLATAAIGNYLDHVGLPTSHVEPIGEAHDHNPQLSAVVDGVRQIARGLREEGDAGKTYARALEELLQRHNLWEANDG